MEIEDINIEMEIQDIRRSILKIQNLTNHLNDRLKHLIDLYEKSNKQSTQRATEEQKTETENNSNHVAHLPAIQQKTEEIQQPMHNMVLGNQPITMEDVDDQQTVQQTAVVPQPIQDEIAEFILPTNVENNLRMEEFRTYKVCLTNKDWSNARKMKDQFLTSWTKEHPNEEPRIIPDQLPYTYLQRRQYNTTETEVSSFHIDIEPDDLVNRNRTIYYI